MLLTLGQMYTNARGKNQRSGGSVLYPTGGRQFARQNVKPTNPNSTYQQQVRNNFSAAASLFSTISQSLKEEWDTLAAQNLRTDPNGDPYNPGGQGYFVGVNSTRLHAGVATETGTPFAINFDGPDLSAAPELAIGGATITFPISYNYAGNPVIFLIELTPAISTPARLPGPDDYKTATVDPADSYIDSTTSPQTITLTVADLRFSIAEGNRVGIRVTSFSDEYWKGSSRTFVGLVTQAS